MHVDGLKGVGSKESDLILFGSTLDALDLAPKVNDIIVMDNQYSRLKGALRMFCTAFNPMMSICSIYDFYPNEHFWKEFREYAQKEYGYEEGVGNYTSTGVDCARNFWNMKNKDRKVVSYRRDLLSKEIEDVMNKRYGVVVSYKGNTAYNNDYMSDSVLNGHSFGSHTYGHVTCTYKIGSSIYIVDSADGKPYNVYKIENSRDKLINSGTFYPSAYVMLPDPNSNDKEKAFRKEYEEGLLLGITNVPYEEAEQRKKEVVVQDVRLYHLIKEDVS